VLKVLVENYRVNPGLHMSLEDIRQFLAVSDQELMKHLASLEQKGKVSTWRNKKGDVELVKPTLIGIKETNGPEYYGHVPSWASPKDIF